jgi:hypothetical protein
MIDEDESGVVVLWGFSVFVFVDESVGATAGCTTLFYS